MWGFLSRYGSQALQFLSTVLVARSIGPEAFGLVGMVAAFAGFVGLFAELGMGAALVQRKELTLEQADAAFILTIATGLFMALVFGAASPSIAAFYHRPTLASVAAVSASGFVLSAIGVVPRAWLVRNMLLRRLALVDFVGAAAGSIASVVLARFGAGLWAIVLGPLLTSAVSSGLALWTSRWSPRWPDTLRAALPLVAVSFHMLGFNVVNYWGRTLDNLLIGYSLGELELGLYVRAYSLMMLPVSQVAAVLSNAMLPALSRLQDDPRRASAGFLEAAGLIGFVGFPVMLGLGAVAHPFIAFVFGPSWIGSAPILQLLAPVGALQAVISPLGWIYISTGRTDLMLRWALFACSVMMGGFVVGVLFGSSVAVAASYLITNLVLAAPAFLLAGRLIGIIARDWWRVLGASLSAAAVMAFVVALLEAVLRRHVSPALSLLVLVPAGFVLYVALTFASRNPAFPQAASFVAAALARIDRSGRGLPGRWAAAIRRWIVASAPGVR